MSQDKTASMACCHEVSPAFQISWLDSCILVFFLTNQITVSMKSILKAKLTRFCCKMFYMQTCFTNVFIVFLAVHRAQAGTDVTTKCEGLQQSLAKEAKKNGWQKLGETEKGNNESTNGTGKKWTWSQIDNEQRNLATWRQNSTLESKTSRRIQILWKWVKIARQGAHQSTRITRERKVPAKPLLLQLERLLQEKPARC